jgi:hypothetical protein
VCTDYKRWLEKGRGQRGGGPAPDCFSGVGRGDHNKPMGRSYVSSEEAVSLINAAAVVRGLLRIYNTNAALHHDGFP